MRRVRRRRRNYMGSGHDWERMVAELSKDGGGGERYRLRIRPETIKGGTLANQGPEQFPLSGL